MKKIIIIGGGIGGLACATAWAETGNFDISIYESDIIGGQASSKKSKLCNTEISWRVFGTYYDNLSSIMKDLNIEDNFYKIENNDFRMNNHEVSHLTHPYSSAIKHNNINQLNRILEVFFFNKRKSNN